MSEQLLVQHSEEDLFELVSDIRQYPSFIKWIEALSIRDEARTDDQITCNADVSVDFKGFQERFTSRMIADRSTKRIDVQLVRGPLRRLRNRWQFDARDEDHTRVHFFLDYEFRNPVLSMLAAANTQVAVDRIISAFMKEADRRYGKPVER